MRHLLPVALALLACRPDRDDGTGPTPALAELTAFQAVAVPLLADQRAVPEAERAAPLVAGRAGVLRATAEVPPGWSGELELVVELTSGGATTTLRASALPGDALLIELPASALAADTTAAVTLRSEGTTLDRFPDAGEVALDAQVTGPLKVHLVPFEVNGFRPDSSAAVVEGYRAALAATWPVTEVLVDVGAVEPWADGPLDLGALVVRVGELQEQAMFDGETGWDVYWYGMATGVATREEFDGITGTSEDGGDETPTRAYFAAGAAFGDQKSEDTLIHELGHTHRLLHTACDGEDDPDPDYPHDGASIGVEGWDVRTGEFVPVAGTFDLMSYCFPRWVSDYSYAKLADHVALAQDFEGPPQ